MTRRTALVTGATGLVGSYLLTHLLERGGWDIVTVSRRKPDVPGATGISRWTCRQPPSAK
jgi:uncharacterized protein YbjT (DUF2867 family)